MREPCFWRPFRKRIFRRSIQRATVWVALVAQVATGVPIAALAQSAGQGQAAPDVRQPAKPPLPAVHVNRTVPKVTPPSARPSFSADPVDLEITNARVFGEPLVTIGRGTLAGENHALATAIVSYLDAHNPEQVLPFLGFLKTYPDSPWRASLLLNLGLTYRHTGYFLRALDVWEQVWLATKTATDAKARGVADRALGELLALNARLGRFERLEALFAETKNRVVTGPATEQITAAREGLWMMRNTPEKAFLCGPLAVDQVLAASRAGYVRDEKILHAKSTQQGTSLAQLQKLAADLNLPLTMVKRDPGAAVLLPAVMHWKAGHFAALIREANGKFLIRDPTFGDELWVSRTALDEEASGYLLVRPQAWPDGWRPVEQAEGEQVWGKGQTDGNDPDQTHDDDDQSNPCEGPGGPGGPGPSGGMPTASVHLMVVSLHLVDTPVGYTPGSGPAVMFTLMYNQREAHQPSTFTFSNLGSKWLFDWLSYVEDDPTNPAATAYVAVRGGGRDTFQGFNSTTQAYQPEIRNRSVLVRTSSSPIRYQRQVSDGSVEVFSVADGASTFPRRVFLTEWRDAQGNALTFTYDAQARLVAATDALGQVTTLSYADPQDSRRITQVTDPFGRHAAFDYDTAGRLWHITDVLGLQSTLSYDAGDFIVALTTPYGTTRFSKGENGLDRWAEVTDPLGATERVEYKVNAPVPASEPAEAVPQNLGLTNAYLNYRNTFYWNKRAMAAAPGNPASAHIFHWLHTSGPLNQTSGTLESEKAPLERRVWYRYPGQATSIFEGTSKQRSATARVLDDGTTQAWKAEYNDQGNVTKRTDPVGRATSYVYAANGIDLLSVTQTNGGVEDVIASYSNYTAQHRPQTITNAAGQATTMTYTSNGTVSTVTNAKNETTTYVYDVVTGFLQHVTGPVAGATKSYTYDGFGRIRTVTGFDGYQLTLDYDAMDRPTVLTFPDGTTEQLIYDKLHVAERRDRAGRTIKLFYDAARRLVALRDALGRTSTLQWCACGILDALIDAKGQKTSWQRDLEGRVTRELRADGVTATNVTYETTTGRLKSLTDASAQVTTFTYNVDDSLNQIAYTNVTVATPSVSYTYDPSYARLLTMVDGTGTTTFAYKAIGTLGANRLASVNGPLTNDTVAYDYDELGRVVTRTVNGATNQTRAYDALGRVVTETTPLGSFTYGYDGLTSRLTSRSFPNGQTSTFSYYNNLGDRRLQTIHHKDPANATLSKFDLAYDVTGNVLTARQQVGAANPVDWRYGYDAADQLLTAVQWTTDTTPAVLKRYAYTYDSAENRASEQIDDAVKLASHDSLNHLQGQAAGGPMRVAGTVSEPATVTIQGKPATVAGDNTFAGTATLTAGTNTFTVTAVDASANARTQTYSVDATGPAQTYTYDGLGNLTSDGVRDFEWDAANRLVAVNQGTHRSEFTYDGADRRVRIVEKDNGVTTRDAQLVWDALAIVEERLSTGDVNHFFYAGEQHGSDARYLTRDQLGSIREVTDGVGALVTRNDYDPYGRLTRVAGTEDTRFGFTGHYNHVPTTLALAVYRGYDSGTGRWLSEDPIGNAAGPNLYAYVRNAPTGFSDPFGLQEVMMGGLPPWMEAAAASNAGKSWRVGPNTQGPSESGPGAAFRIPTESAAPPYRLTQQPGPGLRDILGEPSELAKLMDWMSQFPGSDITSVIPPDTTGPPPNTTGPGQRNGGPTCPTPPKPPYPEPGCYRQPNGMIICVS